jgi:8-oxo-dGTP pyrophosphatase MutT (NUDIX family)
MDKKIATLVLPVRDGKVLLGLKVRKGADIGEQTVNGPGGKLDPGQTLESCAIAETQEETGITLLPEHLRQAGIVTFHNGNRSVWEVHVYLAEGFGGEPIDTEEMVAGPGGWWYAIDQLPFERMLSSDREWMPRLLDGERLRVEVYQNEDAHVLERVEFSNL